MTRLLLPFLAVVCLVLLLACGAPEGPEVPTEEVAPRPTEPVAAAQYDLQHWQPELLTWQALNEVPFEGDGHQGASELTTYANPIAAMSYGKSHHYDEGAAFALVGKEDGQEVRWLMVKLPVDTAPEGNDWYFSKFDATGKMVLGGSAADQGVDGECMSCHRFGAAGTDYVFGPPRAMELHQPGK